MSKHVLVTVPNEHWIHSTVASVLVRMMQDRRYRLTIDLPCERPYENNLHHIMARVVEGPYDYWLSIDADNAPQQNPLDLVELDLDVVGCPTPVWAYRGEPGERPFYWNAYRYDPAANAYREWLPREKLQEVDAIGSGCFLVARRVCEHPALQGGAFSRRLDERGRVLLGSDLAFSERVKLAGFHLWCHFDYPCHHAVELDLDLVARSVKSLLTEAACA